MATPNLGMTLPTVGASTDVWGTVLNAAFDLIDAHDHTAGKGVRIPSAALRINADVSWSFGGTNFAITDALAVDFTPSAAASMTSYSSALFANSSDANNLYYRNSAGTNVKITDGSTLNVSIVGGIGGDYSSVSALLDYDDATDTYRFRQETAAAVRQFGKVSCSNLQLFEYLAAGVSPVPANSVRLASPAALAGSYTLTLPGALTPVVTSLVMCSPTGTLTFTNTTTSGITAADFLHTNTFILNLPGTVARANSNTTFPASGLTGAIETTGSTNLVWPIPLKVGDRITSVTWRLYGDAAVDITSADVIVTDNAEATTNIGSTTLSNVTATPQDLTINVTDTTMVSGSTFIAQLSVNATGLRVLSCQVSYDRPV